MRYAFVFVEGNFSQAELIDFLTQLKHFGYRFLTLIPDARTHFQHYPGEVEVRTYCASDLQPLEDFYWDAFFEWALTDQYSFTLCEHLVSEWVFTRPPRRDELDWASLPRPAIAA